MYRSQVSVRVRFARSVSPLALVALLSSTAQAAIVTAREPAGATDDPVPDTAVEPAPNPTAPPASTPDIETEPVGEGTPPVVDAQPPPEEPPADPTKDTNSRRSGTALSGQATVDDDGLPNRAEVVGKQKKRPKNLTHFRTGAVFAAFGMGYGLATAGDKYCGEFSSSMSDADGRKSLCTAATKPALDLGLAYGVHPRIDVVLGVRLNMTPRDYDDSACEGGAATCAEGKGLFVTKRAFAVLPGIRLWGADNDKVFKVGGGVDLLYVREDFSGYRDRQLGPREDPTDEQNTLNEQNVGDSALGLRGGPVLQVDPHHNVGIFFMPAAVVSFRPALGGADKSGWFETAFEATLGVQARFP